MTGGYLGVYSMHESSESKVKSVVCQFILKKKKLVSYIVDMF